MSSQDNNFSLEQKTVQRQAGLPLTLQLMHLVELPYTSLEQEIRNTVDDNPALEIYDDNEPSPESQEEPSAEEYDDNGVPMEIDKGQLPDDEIFKEDYYRDYEDFEDEMSELRLENQIAKLNSPADIPQSQKTNIYYESLHEQWQNQLDEMPLTERESQIATYLIGTLDDSGYLNADLQAVANELLYNENIQTTVDELTFVLTHYIQELEPAGTGARNLKECLLLQLDRLPEKNRHTEIAMSVVEDCFELLTKRHYDKISSQLGISNEELKGALQVIQKLDPRPALQETPLQKNAETIIPDFTITKSGNKLQLSLNNNYIPKVRINKEFSNEYRFLSKQEYDRKKNEAERFMKKYVDDGQQFIRTLSLREMLLYNTMYAIMKHQYEYFLTGDNAKLKPMILKTIAQEVGADISTVSRVSNSKYVQTDFGIIPLKHLFSEAVNDDDVSSKEIKQILGELVGNEDKRKPLSDEKICAMLNEKGYNIARRTVAKYREQLNIPVARLRKEI